MKQRIWVTGASGQLGMELQKLSQSHNRFEFVFSTRDQFPLDDPDTIRQIINTEKPAYFINGAAYTAVDKAESEKELAYRINAEAPGLIARACRESGTRLIHISTDYVFSGQGNGTYKETDVTDPVNYYGESKRDGEIGVLQNNPDAIIIRTSWVYSEYGKNFVKTMLRLMKERDQVGVVNDQTGTPTYAADLAEAILEIITRTETGDASWIPGLYHFSNEGVITWYEFASAIKEISGSSAQINPIPTSSYPLPARRPAWSVLDKSLIQEVYGIRLKDWRKSLITCLDQIGK